MSFDGVGEVGEGVAALLAAGFDDGQHRLDEAAAGGALRAEGELPPDHGVTQGPLAGVVGRFDAFGAEKGPQPTAMLVQFAAHALTNDRLPLCAPRSSKCSTAGGSAPSDARSAAREIVPSR